MQKIFIILFFSLFISVSCVFAAANLQEKQNTENAASSATTKSTVLNPAEKLNRGIVNIITAPIEIAKQIDLSWKQSAQKSKYASTGIFSGFVKGLVYTVGRTGSGIWDILSFPFKTPDNYAPLMKPDFVLDDMDTSPKKEKTNHP